MHTPSVRPKKLLLNQSRNSIKHSSEMINDHLPSFSKRNKNKCEVSKCMRNNNNINYIHVL